MTNQQHAVSETEKAALYLAVRILETILLLSNGAITSQEGDRVFASLIKGFQAGHTAENQSFRLY